MNNRPLISVIIPIFNAEKYIKKCLNSITKQSLNQIEIICINDGSNDNTLNILEKYSSKDNRIKVISTENKGQAAARNLGLSKANGEYISFIDSDDWISKNAFEMLYSRAKKDDLDLLFFQLINYIDSSGKYSETDLYNHDCFYIFSDEDIFNYNDVKNFIFKIPVCPVSKLYKKEFLLDNNFKFPEGIVFEDNPFFYDCLFKCNKSGFLKQHLYYRRRHKDSATQIFDSKKFDVIQACNLMFEIFFENNKYEFHKAELINHTFEMLKYWFDKAPFECKDTFYKLIKSNFIGLSDLNKDFHKYLEDKFLLLFETFENNDYYLDFLSEYKLKTAEYTIFDDGHEYKLNSDSYYQYKSKKSDNSYLISVIIPIYNNEEIIHRTIMSIENQTFGLDDIEVLMINDCSTDNTSEVINSYADKYKGFKAIHIHSNTGSPGTPRNIGLKESSGDYVIFLDHDDFFEINAFECLYETISSNDCDLVYGTYVSIDNSIPTKILYPDEFHGYFKSIEDNKRSIAFPPPSIWTKLFNKSFLLENNILFPTILGEDAIFMSKAILNANGIYYLWNSTICFHDLTSNSHTNNVSYNYLFEGFVSEKYMYDFYSDLDDNNSFYKIRGEGILNFYLNQFKKSKLNKKEIIDIFPLLYDFVYRLNSFNLLPSEENMLLFNKILEKDLAFILKLKIKHPIIQNIKSITKKILNKLK